MRLAPRAGAPRSSRIAPAARIASTRDGFDEQYRHSIQDPNAFWLREAEEGLQLQWQSPPREAVRDGSWFPGGCLNACHNALDRHVAAGGGARIAFYVEPNDETGGEHEVTYAQLHDRVCRIASYLSSRGVGVGDRVLIFIPSCVDAPAAMLACARIGAVHVSISCGYAAPALAKRIAELRPKAAFTAPATRRGAAVVPIKAVLDSALGLSGFDIPLVLVSDHCRTLGRPDMCEELVPWTRDRDVWLDEAAATQAASCPLAWVDAAHPLFMLFTSGGTGAPKPVVHSTAGYLVYAASSLKHSYGINSYDTLLATGDMAWLFGHTCAVYGPLLLGVSSVLYEGSPLGGPSYPDPGRLWRIVDRLRVSILLTQPAVLRRLARHGDAPVRAASRASLRVLGSAGGTLSLANWSWLAGEAGGWKLPVVDSYWATESAGPLLAAPLAVPGGPASARPLLRPCLGVRPVLLDESAAELAGAAVGDLCFAPASWPGAAQALPAARGLWASGDAARRDASGGFALLGRSDDVLLVGGQLIAAAEVEAALASHPLCLEAAAVARPRSAGGGIYCFVSLVEDAEPGEGLSRELRRCVREAVGPEAEPAALQFAPQGLPRSRSGALMRRLLRRVACGDEVGALDEDLSTCKDPWALPPLFEGWRALRARGDAPAETK